MFNDGCQAGFRQESACKGKFLSAMIKNLAELSACAEVGLCVDKCDVQFITHNYFLLFNVVFTKLGEMKCIAHGSDKRLRIGLIAESMHHYRPTHDLFNAGLTTSASA